MASIIARNIALTFKKTSITDNVCRSLFSTSSLVQESRGWFDKLLVRKIEPTKESHSSVLSDKEVIYELQTHNVKPGTSEEYLKNYEQYVKEIGEHKDMHMELCGSWTVGVGDQDQCVHLWKYDGGFQSIDNAKKVMDHDKPLQALVKDRAPFLRSRHNQFVLAFSFWPTANQRAGPNIYEIRSYFLKPGTMIEWSNNWERAITFRQSHNEAWGGYFSQVGRLYTVHHIWCYKSLQVRKENREDAWLNTGWESIVSHTVPLIRKYNSKMLYSNTFSPTH